jgi:NAD(P)-dependent dehydrogenase (short-subunit alcohol dehydrogenase family)
MADPFHSFRIDGRRALVTGGDAGIGMAIAETLVGAGARLAVNGLTGSSAVAARWGSGAIGIDADIGTPDALEALITRIGTAFGGLDILVLNAAVQFREPWHAVTSDTLDRQIDVNLKASYRLIQAFLPGMVERGWGRLLAIGSVQETKPHPEMLVYAALKAALTNMVRNIARQVAASGVTCNVLVPGAIATDRNRDALSDPAYLAEVLARIPTGYVGIPEDCAATALMLCSNAGRYLTGVTIPVDGGMGL